MVAQFPVAGRACQLHDLDHFTPPGIRHPDHGAVLHCRVTAHHPLPPPGADVFPPLMIMSFLRSTMVR